MQTTKFVVIITREKCFKCQTDKYYIKPIEKKRREKKCKSIIFE